MSAKNIEIVTDRGTECFIPLNKLKKSPMNACKTPHAPASYALVKVETTPTTRMRAALIMILLFPNEDP